jgi:RNA polymerase sigma-70 factor (ECF subfamily)
VAYGDEAIATVARERGRALVAYGYLLTGDLRDAQDAVRHALVRTVVREPGADAVAAEALVRRTMLTTFASGRHVGHVRDGIPAARPAQDDRSPVPPRTALHDALLALPPEERACVVLHHVDGLDADRIGRVLDLSTGTVRRHLAHGRWLLESAGVRSQVEVRS